MNMMHDYMTEKQFQDKEIGYYSSSEPGKFKNYMEAYIPTEFLSVGMDLQGTLVDSKDFVTDTSRLNSEITRE